MPLKEFAFLMMLGGSFACVAAGAMHGRASFESATFMVEIVLGAGGVIAFSLGAVMMVFSILLCLP